MQTGSEISPNGDPEAALICFCLSNFIQSPPSLLFSFIVNGKMRFLVSQCLGNGVEVEGAGDKSVWYQQGHGGLLRSSLTKELVCLSAECSWAVSVIHLDSTL